MKSVSLTQWNVTGSLSICLGHTNMAMWAAQRQPQARTVRLACSTLVLMMGGVIQPRP
jgi:hypothetical protein